MNYIIHKADSRGTADHGWLSTFHTFSFADYYDPDRVHFGALRVLNDDIIAGGTGFGHHPHNNMEIVTIILEGEVKHTDSMGHEQVLREHEVQTMSAGTGIIHSEMNNLPDKPAKLLQIWVLPEKKNTSPRYSQKSFDPLKSKNRWQLLAGPAPVNEELEIRQRAWFQITELDKNHQINYEMHDVGNGVYFFNISGKISLAGDLILENRDGAGVTETEKLNLEALENSKLLAIEIPMF